MAGKAKQPKPAAKVAAEPVASADDWRSYRALSDCRVGHLRREGEVFAWPAFDECPDHLEEVDCTEAAETDPDDNAAPAAHQGATLADLGLGEAKPAGDVTSGDMINR